MEQEKLVKILYACGGKGNNSMASECRTCPLRNESKRCFYAWLEAAELIEEQATRIAALTAELDRAREQATNPPFLKRCTTCHFSTAPDTSDPCAACKAEPGHKYWTPPVRRAMFGAASMAGGAPNA